MANAISFDQFKTTEAKMQMMKTLTEQGNLLYCVYDNFVATPFLYNRALGAVGKKFGAPHCFIGALNNSQQTLVDQALDILKQKSSILLTVFCGGGKTVMILHLLAQIGLPVLILVPKVALINQWHARIKQFCPTLQYHIQTGRKTPPTNYPVLVLDEAHQLFSPQNFQTILKVYPDFLIGATATPWRPNEIDKFKWFFADQLTFARPPINSTVWVLQSRLKPPIKLNATGRLDWNELLNWQATDLTRTAQIIDACRKAPTPQLILIKRLVAANLLNFDPASTQLICGTDHSIEIRPTTKYVIATFSKLGTGFDFSKFKTLVLTSDVVEYFEQFAGRVLRSQDGDALFIDVVDDFSPLWTHFHARTKFYNALGANIKFIRGSDTQTPTHIRLLK